MTIRKEFNCYKEIINQKFPINSYGVYKLIAKKNSYARLLKFTKQYLHKNPNHIISMKSLLKLFNDTKIVTACDLTAYQQVKLIKCVNYWGHNVRVRPMSADFGFAYRHNMAIWEIKSKNVSQKRILHLTKEINVHPSFLKNAHRHSYLCPPHMMGMSKFDCMIYGKEASRPSKPSNTIWKMSNENGYNACLGPKIRHLASQYYWQRVKEYVHARSIFWYWFKIVIEKNCQEYGKYRATDIKDFDSFMGEL